MKNIFTWNPSVLWRPCVPSKKMKKQICAPGKSSSGSFCCSSLVHKVECVRGGGVACLPASVCVGLPPCVCSLVVITSSAQTSLPFLALYANASEPCPDLEVATWGKGEEVFKEIQVWFPTRIPTPTRPHPRRILRKSFRVRSFQITSHKRFLFVFNDYIFSVIVLFCFLHASHY